MLRSWWLPGDRWWRRKSPWVLAEASPDVGLMDKLHFYLIQTGTGSIEEIAAAPSEPGVLLQGDSSVSLGTPQCPHPALLTHSHATVSGPIAAPNNTFSISTSQSRTISTL